LFLFEALWIARSYSKRYVSLHLLARIDEGGMFQAISKWIGHRASGIGHRASGIGHRASGIGHRASGIGPRA
jgi:hypothetical protein